MDQTIRFTCVQENSGKWSVWDRREQSIAILGGCTVQGREKSCAQAACDVLMRIFRNRLDAKSVKEDAAARAV